MPYIKIGRRKELENDIENLAEKIMGAGELNFVIFSLVKRLIGEGYEYASLNMVMGVFESCKLEFYRRVVVPDEELKITENGDIK